MVARPQKNGSEICAKEDCVGYGQLGRVRHHSRISSKNPDYARPSGHDTFIHNDRNIREHYVRKYKILQDENEPDPAKIFTELGYTFRKISERHKVLQKDKSFEKEDLIRLYHALNWTKENIVVPQQIIADIETGRIKDTTGVLGELRGWLDQIMISQYNPLFGALGHIYEKYDKDKRIERNTTRNAKLRESYNNPPRTLLELFPSN